MNAHQDSISPYVRLAHDYHTPIDFSLGTCCIKDHAIHYIKTGSGNHTINDESYPIKPGAVFIVRPDTPFSLSTAPGTSMHMLNIHFDLMERTDSVELPWPYQFDGGTRDFFDFERLSTNVESKDYLPAQLQISNAPGFECLFYRVHGLYGLRDYASSLQMKSAMLELLAYLFRVAQEQSTPTLPKHEKAMRAAVRFIQDHYQQPIQLSEIADFVSLSEPHFSALFKIYFGTSPMKFVVQSRMDRAKLELSLSDLPIKNIAHLVGYDSIHHFSRAFKQSTGLPPDQYRRMYTPKSQTQ